MGTKSAAIMRLRPQRGFIMGCKGVLLGLMASALIATAVVGTAPLAGAQQESVLHSFGGSGDGSNPSGVLVLDKSGNIYGATFFGGAYGSGSAETGGTVFEVTPVIGGGWTEAVLHSFSGGDDGEWPYSGVILDAADNLYGPTFLGGAYGQGTEFELKRGAGGEWNKAILHSFANDGMDGSSPNSALVFDGAGNLYGTTLLGGSHGVGSVFKLALRQGGGWLEEILHNFDNNGIDGEYPGVARLVFDAAGNLYGATTGGGPHGAGVVFELMPQPSGKWTEKLLHAFGRAGDGAQPQTGVVLDSAGNLYGTTANGGSDGVGTVFELTPAANGSWAEAILYNFSGSGDVGFGPGWSPTLDASGNLYSTTDSGGVYGYGTAFELTPTAGGTWTGMILHSFDFNGTDGYLPGGVVFDGSGNLYGTTYLGGVYNYGTVFEIVP